MRDPMNWSLPLFRAFGVPVRLHLLFIIVTVGMFLRQVAFTPDNPVWWVDVLGITVLLPFVVILLHEFGHCFGARAVGGDAKEILMWPLGGLAFNDVPHTPRANFITSAAGPGVNVVICVACAVGLAAGGFLPNLNPLASPYRSEVTSYRDGRVHTSEYGLKLYKPGSTEPLHELTAYEAYVKKTEGLRQQSVYSPEQADSYAKLMGGERAVAPGWVAWLNRAFWLSWVLLLFNLIPAYPLDGGQMMQAVIWARTDYRRGVVVAAYSGFGFGVLFMIVSIGYNEGLFMGLAFFMLVTAWMKLHALETEEGPFGYDFSAGYTSLERDDEPRPRPKKRPGAIARWWQARKVRKLQREHERRARDEERKELLLEKIVQSGMTSLTDEERRFLAQFSARYRNRS